MKGKIRIRAIIAITLLWLGCIGVIPMQGQVNPAIQPYVDFLSEKPLSAKAYILSLFKEHNIVFICERDHRDITQYELYLDLLRDPYFVNQVGVLFTEVGSRSLNPELNRFLHTPGLDSTEVDKHYQRQKGVPEQNVGRFLFEAFPGQCANVLMNQFALRAIRSDNDIAITPTQSGKWDAAFQYLGMNNAGFDFSGTPFGKDNFDHDPRTYPSITYQDVFTGFVYYRSIPEFRIAVGVPHIAEDGFAAEYEKREAVFYELMQEENPHEAREQIRELNQIKEQQEDFLPELMTPIRQWLE